MDKKILFAILGMLESQPFADWYAGPMDEYIKEGPRAATTERMLDDIEKMLNNYGWVKPKMPRLIKSHLSPNIKPERRKVMKFYIYDCDHGQGIVTAETIEEARREALLDCGRNDAPQNVRLATTDDIAW